VKPTNVLVSLLGEPVLSDFAVGLPDDLGIARTPAHAAPELWDGEPATPESDVWSLASTLFAALAGRPPFGAGSPPRLGDIALPPLDRDDVPPELVATVAAALARRPEDRPTAEELAGHLGWVARQTGAGAEGGEDLGAGADTNPRGMPPVTEAAGPPRSPSPAHPGGVEARPPTDPHGAYGIEEGAGTGAEPAAWEGTPTAPPHRPEIRLVTRRGTPDDPAAYHPGVDPTTGGAPGADEAGVVVIEPAAHGSGAAPHPAPRRDRPAAAPRPVRPARPAGAARDARPARSTRPARPVRTETRDGRWGVDLSGAGAVLGVLAGTAVAVAVVASVATFLTGQSQAPASGPVRSRTVSSETEIPAARASATLSPRAAAKVHVTGATRSTVTLAWDDTNNGRAAYVVVVDAGTTPVAPQRADGPGAHIVQGLRPGTSYCFTVRTGTGAVTPVTMPVCAQTAR
jgi:hypothetical protein